jgi:hypothetical protein
MSLSPSTRSPAKTERSFASDSNPICRLTVNSYQAELRSSPDSSIIRTIHRIRSSSLKPPRSELFFLFAAVLNSSSPTLITSPKGIFPGSNGSWTKVENAGLGSSGPGWRRSAPRWSEAWMR